MSKSTTRHPYMRGYEFWKENRFWETIPGLTEAGRMYYENWLNDLKTSDKKFKLKL